MNEAGEFRLREGITFSFPTLENATFGFSVAAGKLELAEADRFTLQFVASYGLGCALALAGGHVGSGTVHLSRRQREAVAWASEGLTIDEIAERLSVSIHTADMHLRAVRARLGVANTVPAVAEALRLANIETRRLSLGAGGLDAAFCLYYPGDAISPPLSWRSSLWRESSVESRARNYPQSVAILGRVDKPDPLSDRSNLNEAEKARS